MAVRIDLTSLTDLSDVELVARFHQGDAEAVFREDLKRNARNGRSLFGLMESLKAQKKTADAEWVRKQYEEAWKGSPALRVEDL